MSSCSNCQASLPPGGAFCAECGAAVPVGSGGSSGSPTPTPGTLPPPVNPAPPSAAGSRQQSSRGTPTAPSSPQGQVREPSTDGVPLPPPMLSGVPLPPPPLAGATPPSAPPQTQPPSAMPVPPPSNAVPVSQPPRQGPSVAMLVTLTVLGVLLLGGAGIAVVMLNQSPTPKPADPVVPTTESLAESSGGSDQTGGGYEPVETVPQTVPPTAAPDPSAIYANRDDLYNDTVAVVWSQVASANDPGWAQQVEQKVDEYTRRFGGEFVGFRGDDFGSTKSGTIGVAYVGGFDDARSGAVWCKDNGMVSNYECFGLRLSDDFGPEVKGPSTRFYPVSL